MRTIVGIDPGKSGGIAILHGNGDLSLVKLEALTDRETCHELQQVLVDIGDGQSRVCESAAYIEDPRGVLPGKRTPKSIAGPAESFGFLRGLLVALNFKIEIVKPAKWQAGFKLPKLRDCKSTTEKKRAHREAAQRLFPVAKATNWSADALLIAEYGRRIESEHSR